MQNKGKAISFIVPTYRSSAFITNVLQNIINLGNSLNREFEVIVVDDGSPDDTFNVLQNFLKTRTVNNLKIIRLSRNYGQQNATLCGINNASYNYVFTLDDDYLYTKQDILDIINAHSSFQNHLIYGVLGANTSKSILQKFFTKIWYLVVSLFSDFKQPCTSFRFFDKTGFHASLYGMYFNLDEQLNLCGYQPHFVKLTPTKSLRAISNYKTTDLITHAKKIILGYTLLPSRFFTVLGFFSAFISFAIGFYYLMVHLFVAKQQLGFTALIVAITFGTGIVLLGIGVALQYIRALTLSQKEVPLYIVDEQE